MKTRQLGTIPVDAGDVVCFSMDRVLAMAEAAGYGEDVQEFIEDNRGVACALPGDGVYGVDQATAVDDKGKTYSVAVIGLPDNARRLLDDGEQTFREWYDARKGTMPFDEIAHSHEEYVRGEKDKNVPGAVGQPGGGATPVPGGEVGQPPFTEDRRDTD